VRARTSASGALGACSAALPALEGTTLPGYHINKYVYSVNFSN
jgi:hypothetical protein